MAQVIYCPFCAQKLTIKNIGGKDYPACPSESCGYVFWDNPLPVVAAIIEHRKEVLLARNKLWPPKMYGLITGFLEKGEAPEDAVLREVREELNLDGQLAGLVGIYSFPQQNQIILAYHVKAEGDITMSDELEDVIYVPPEKLKPWNFGTGLAVRDWLAKRGIDAGSQRTHAEDHNKG